MKTEQESFWEGDFGNEYIDRNNDNNTLPGRINVFSQVIRQAQGVESVFELGCNIGMNLEALKILRPRTKFHAVEINKKACDKIMDEKPWVDVQNRSLLDSGIETKADLVFTSGVLIHIAPEALHRAYSTMYKASKKYIALVEYYNPFPVEVNYRGHLERLFKRDFAGDLIDRFADLKLLDYGFIYRRDHNFPMDDPTWFLLEKVR